MSWILRETAVENLMNFFIIIFSGLWQLFCESVRPSGIDKRVTSDPIDQRN